MDYLKETLENKAKVIEAQQGEILRFGDSSVNLKLTSEDTNDQLGIYEVNLEPGAIGAKPHYHRFMDETFIVNEGVLTVWVGDKEKEVCAGTLVYVPRLTPHGFRNAHDQKAIVTLIFNPGEKREGFFKGLNQILTTNPIDPGAFLKLYNKYDSYPIDLDNMMQLD